jgi:hypothetical protein
VSVPISALRWAIFSSFSISAGATLIILGFIESRDSFRDAGTLFIVIALFGGMFARRAEKRAEKQLLGSEGNPPPNDTLR